jgi:hypothetical protein
MSNVTTYIVVPAPGHYGDRTRVMSSHRTLRAALRAAGPGYVVRASSASKGDTFLRCYEQTAREVRA